jgi:hypothetical protein
MASVEDFDGASGASVGSPPLPSVTVTAGNRLVALAAIDETKVFTGIFSDVDGAFTLLGTQAEFGSGSLKVASSLWQLLNPTVGVHVISATTDVNAVIILGVASVVGAGAGWNAGSPDKDEDDDGGTSTIVADSAAGEILFECYNLGFPGSGGLPSFDSGQTTIYAENAVLGTSSVLMGYKVSSGATENLAVTAVSPNYDSSNYAHIVGSLQVAGGATIDQSAYQFLEDDAAEGANTPLAAENTPITIEPGVPFRLRLQLNATGDPTAKNFQLEYRPAGSSDPWTKV